MYLTQYESFIDKTWTYGCVVAHRVLCRDSTINVASSNLFPKREIFLRFFFVTRSFNLFGGISYITKYLYAYNLMCK